MTIIDFEGTLMQNEFWDLKDLSSVHGKIYNWNVNYLEAYDF